MAITVNWPSKIINVPRNDMILLQVNPIEIRELDTDWFRLQLKILEASPEGIVFSDTHNHTPGVEVGGVVLARVIEIINDYTVTFEDGQYAVNLTKSNNNIGDRVNFNQVSIRTSNSAGLIQTREIEQASYNGKVYMDTTNGVPGSIYPVGTLQAPVNNLADAKIVGTQRGLNVFALRNNLTLGATEDVTSLTFFGEGATLNLTKSLVTFTTGCVTTNSSWHNCRITGYQGGESTYTECIIDGLDNAHCIYVNCGFIDGTSRGYTIRQTSAISSSHISYFRNCFSDEGTAIFDRNGARLHCTFDGFHGRIKIINQNHATSSGNVYMHLLGGTVTVDASCTKGRIVLSGFGTLINQTQGTEVDASAFVSESFDQTKISLESLRPTHQGYGSRWFVDSVNGNDLSPGNSISAPVRTVARAVSLAVSGRGDVIFLLSPGAGVTTVDERITLSKEDLHLRGPGRGVEIKPSTAGGGPIISITANNCSLNGLLIRTNSADSSDDGVLVNAKFSRLENLYLVGPDTGGVTPVGTGHGMHFKGGDYHKVINCEIEKFGGDGVRFTDDPINSVGSPREVRIDECNIYYNRGAGVRLTGVFADPLNSTRLNILTNNRIQHNSDYGVYIGANTMRTMVINTNYIADNQTFPTGEPDPTKEIYIDPDAGDPMIDIFPSDIFNTGVGIAHDVESLRPTHMGFGHRFYVDPVSGDDANSGTILEHPAATIAHVMTSVQSGRGDVIYLLAPTSGAATITERVVINKEDVHLRGPGRGIQFQPTTADLGDVITIDANNCSLSGFIVRAPAGSTTDNCITINGKFSKMTKLYLVGTQAGTGNGFLYRGGDYHELIDCESEKMGGSGLKTVDAGLASGSPREITIQGGNYYLNNEYGLNLTGTVPTTSTRIIRIRKVNIHDNVSYGIFTDANTSDVVIDTSTMLHGNNNDGVQLSILGTGVDYLDKTSKLIADEVRVELDPELDHILTLQNGAGLDTTQATMLLEIYRLYGLDPALPLVVSGTERTVGGNIIEQTITTTATETTVTRV